MTLSSQPDSYADVAFVSHNTIAPHAASAPQQKTALVVGASGATGQCLIDFLVSHPSYASVVAFSRRPVKRKHRKFTNHVVDFDHVEQWSALLSGDELFSALGTTLMLAGDRDEQFKVEFTHQLNVAEAARENGVPTIVVVSSLFADPGSRNFYLQTKGDLDHAITELAFKHCALVKPSLIESERPEFRPAELVASLAIRTLASVVAPLRKYKPISAEELAGAIIDIAQSKLPQGVSSFKFDELFKNLSH